MVKVYPDKEAIAVFFEDSNGSSFFNELRAYQIDTSTNLIHVLDKLKGIDIYSSIPYTDYVDEDENPYGNTAEEVVNNLNAVFSATGSSGEVPVITSPTSINAIAGEVINYELSADYSTSHEWVNLPSGTTILAGSNGRKLIGIIPSNGIYTPEMIAINYFGIDQQTLTINVANPPFENTKSVRFNYPDFLEGNASLLNSSLGRTNNGSGASDAWTIAFWFKAGTSSNNNQNIFYFGNNFSSFGNAIKIGYEGNPTRRRLKFRYGSDYNNLEFTTPQGSIPQNQWKHVVVTYDGGTTGSSSGQINDYYSRFKIFIDGVEQTTSKNHTNYGVSSSFPDDLFHIGRSDYTDYLRNNCKVDEVAVWDSDQSSNINDIYNTGTPHDLSAITNPALNWWRCGDGDTFPILVDNIGSADLTMRNMTAADIINDVP